MSQHMMLAPIIQAMPLIHVMIHPRVSLSSPIFNKAGSDPLPHAAEERHGAFASRAAGGLNMAEVKTGTGKRQRQGQKRVM
jgi:hypothetical protein